MAPQGISSAPSSRPLLRRLALLVALLLPYSGNVEGLLLYGCNLSENLCDDGEICYPDGLFGQCYSPSNGVTPPPTVLSDLDDVQPELLQLELQRLATQGQEWSDPRSQCVLAYFKMTAAYDLKYDGDFCQVRNPSNIWALIQLIELGIKEKALEDAIEEEAEAVEEADAQAIAQEQQAQAEEQLAQAVDEVEREYEAEEAEQQLQELLKELSEPSPDFDDNALSSVSLSSLPPTDSEVVSAYLSEILAERQPDLSVLSDQQLNALINSILELKQEYSRASPPLDEDDRKPVEVKSEEEAVVASPQGEIEEEVAVDESLAPTLLKKDLEHLGDVNLGLDPREHNIVKGRRSDVSRVVGNRIYLKVKMKSEEQLLPLIEFLQNTIAIPNNLLFDDFTFDEGQLSLRISRLVSSKEEKAEESGEPMAEGADEKTPPLQKDKRIDSVEGVAQAVYKRRKDIARLSNAEVVETGIGIGDESVPVAKADQDWLFFPLLFVSVFTMTSLVAVLSVHLYKRRRSHYTSNLRQLADVVDGKGALAYQELCRQRMSHDVVGQASAPSGAAAGGHSKTSSTSSWCEDSSVPEQGIDISTGHVLLKFLENSLSDPSRIDAQWMGIREYRNTAKSTSIAERNPSANRSVLPYDENLVPIDDSNDEGTSMGEYLNASFVYDDDPRQAVYIAAQTPGVPEVAAFWRAIWQHGVCLIVNLTSMEEQRKEEAPPYWPDKGSHVHAHFEIHLVSEHIWSDDYLVRSFYLKNLRDGQTRTITQFHYVGWPADGAPASPASLLEFRRKVNKSYRGRSSPLLVHSPEGAGRTGVYCAVDVICARIQRGVKELDIEASLEHLRDQRPQLVKTADQYKFIYACVAHEVSALIKALPQ